MTTAPVPSPAAAGPQVTHRSGVLLGLGAYVMWGLFPLYFRLLDSAGAVEVVLHRIVWSLLVCVLLVLLTRGASALRRLSRRQVAGLGLAALVLSVNWGVFVYGVNSGQVVEVSLGYFINPIVSVLLGVTLLHERLRLAQWVAVGIALLAVLVLTVDYGRPPWLAFTLALSFGTYGLLKNRVGRGVGAVPGLTVETAALAPLALAGLFWLQADGSSSFVTEGPAHAVLLASTGLATALPLLLFAGAARRVPLSTIGMLQYVTPVMQLMIGVLVFSEPLPPTRLAGFALVWLALAVLSVDGLRRSAVSRAQARAALAVRG